jgi:hypothetical protein
MVCPAHSILKIKTQYGANSNSKILLTVNKLVPSQKQMKSATKLALYYKS